MIELSLIHLEKQDEPNDFILIPEPKVTDVRLTHVDKNPSPIVVTLSGIRKDVKLSHNANAKLLIIFNVLGNNMVVKLLQRPNAVDRISINSRGMLTDVKEVHE